MNGKDERQIKDCKIKFKMKIPVLKKNAHHILMLQKMKKKSLSIEVDSERKIINFHGEQ